MRENDDDDKRIICTLLQQAGLAVEQVPESTSQRCDLRATDGEHARYLLEVKGFHDALALAPTLRNGKDYSESLQFDTARNVQSGIHNAVKQMESTAQPGGGELRRLALLVRSKYNPKVVFQQILGELLGRRSIVADSEVPGERKHLECLYASHSDFFRHRDLLDAAIVYDGDGAAFFVNDHRSRVERVRKSALAQFFSAQGALYDAAISERERGDLVADCEIDRNKGAEILQYLAQKYKLVGARWMPFIRYSMMVVE